MNSASKSQKITALVLSSQPYREKDLILKCLSSQGEILSVFAKGVQSAQSKNHQLCNPGSLVELDVLAGSSGACSLIRGRLLKLFDGLYRSLDGQVANSLLIELLQSMQGTEQIYQGFLSFWNALEDPKQEPFFWACFLMARLIEQAGYRPQVQSCISCGSTKKIQAFSIEQGGFICLECNKELGLKAWNPLWLKALYALFHPSKAQGQPENFLGVDWKVLFDWLVDWYAYYAQYQPRSFGFWKRISRR